jgi:hypothetical protein
VTATLPVGRRLDPPLALRTRHPRRGRPRPRPRTGVPPVSFRTFQEWVALVVGLGFLWWIALTAGGPFIIAAAALFTPATAAVVIEVRDRRRNQ